MGDRTEIIKTFGKKYGNGESDTGSSAVQVALLTNRINGLRPHFNEHIHDFHSNRGLMKMIGRRKALLKYIQNRSVDTYKSLIKDLGLRK